MRMITYFARKAWPLTNRSPSAKLWKVLVQRDKHWFKRAKHMFCKSHCQNIMYVNISKLIV